MFIPPAIVYAGRMDISTFIAELAGSGELLQIDTEIDSRLELAFLTDLASKRGGPALLFDRVRATQLKFATNLFGSEQRMAAALDQASLSEFGVMLHRALESVAGADSGERLQHLATGGLTHEIANPWPVEEGNLGFLPDIRFWPQEIRTFLTLCVVVTSDPGTQRQNYGLYRIGVNGLRQLTLNLLPGSGGGEHLARWRRRRERMPVAVLLGADPALIFAAAASLPPQVDETRFGALLQRTPLPICDGLDVPLQLPASAQVVIEGWADPRQTCNEGPFGCHTGDYGGGNDCALIEVSTIRRVAQPLVPLTLAGPLPMEDCWLARANLELVRARLAIDLPEISAVELPLDAAFSGVLLVRSSSRVTAAELAARLCQFDYLAKLKVLAVQYDSAFPGSANWRERLRGLPRGQLWCENDGILRRLLEPQAPCLRHPEALRRALLARLQDDGIGIEDFGGGYAG